MAKLCLVVVVTVLVGVWAEPPSNYRSSQARNALSDQYGAPQQRQQGGFGGRSSGSFSYNSLAENQFGPSRPRSSASVRQQYGAPAFDDSVVTNARARSPGFGAPQQRVAGPVAPRGFGPSARQQPASSYSAAARQQPSSQYGAPAAEYGAPFARSNMEDDLAEPANYEYNYEVQAGDESGAEFGHQETREDDSAQGQYHVLLPDGRLQIVEYEADEEGFRPRIRYEEVGYPDARDSQGPY